jgi:SAM-dependent methyltransferase
MGSGFTLDIAAPDYNPRMSDDGGEIDVLAWTRFLEFFREMPRGGPGDSASMRRALALMTELPAGPRILDLGCGPGTTSGELAKLTGGRVVAFDLQAPFVVGQMSAARGSSRAGAVHGACGDMAAAPFASGSFDLVWSEGALYSIGFRNGLRACAELVRPGGYVAASDAVWTVQEPPNEIRAWWTAEYPDIGSIDAKVADVTSAGFDTVGHFTLPASSWWEHYYKPMLARTAALRVTWAGDDAGLGVLAQLEHEASMFERFGHTYSYEFIVGRRRSSV